MMKKPLIALASLLAAGTVLAQQKPPEPDYTLAFNVGAVTDYRYRGISQSRFRPAVQGGVDFSHKSGVYVGVWGSTIKWIKDAGTIAAANTGNANLEIDLYGGYKGSIIADKLSYDVGGLYYFYPRNKYNNLSSFNGWTTPKADTGEIYGALTFGPVTGKYSHALTNLFGNARSKNSGYLDLSATFDVGGGWSIVPHVGYQRVAGSPDGTFKNSNYSYTDYSVAVNKDFGNGLILTGSVVSTNAKKAANGTPFYPAPDGANSASSSSRNLGRTGVVLGVKYNF
jgi:uncharacterized protein (TIGR02001 family)